MPGDVAEDILENIFRQSLNEFLRRGKQGILDALLTDNAKWRDSFTYKIPNERVPEYQEAFAANDIEFKVQDADEKATTLLVKAEDLDKVRKISQDLNDLGTEYEEVVPEEVPLNPEDLDAERAACVGEGGAIDPEKCKELYNKYVAENPLLESNGIKAHAELSQEGFIDMVYDLDLDNEKIMDLMDKFPDMTPDDAFGFSLLATHKNMEVSPENLRVVAEMYKEEGQPVNDLARGWLDRYDTVEQMSRPYVDFEMEKEAFEKLKASNSIEDKALAEQLEKLMVRGSEAEMEGIDEEAIKDAAAPRVPAQTEGILENDSVYAFKTYDSQDLTRLDELFSAAAASDNSIFPQLESSLNDTQLTYSRKRGLLSKKKLQRALKEIKDAQEKAHVIQQRRAKDAKARTREHGAR